MKSKKFSCNVMDFKKSLRDSSAYGVIVTILAIAHPLFDSFLEKLLIDVSQLDLAQYGLFGTLTVFGSQLLLRFLKERK